MNTKKFQNLFKMLKTHVNKFSPIKNKKKNFIIKKKDFVKKAEKINQETETLKSIQKNRCYCCYKEINFEISHPLFSKNKFCSKKCLKTDFNKFYRICEFCKKLNFIYDCFTKNNKLFCDIKCFENFNIFSKTINEFKYEDGQNNQDSKKNNFENQKNYLINQNNISKNENCEGNIDFKDCKNNLNIQKENNSNENNFNLDKMMNIDFDFDDLL